MSDSIWRLFYDFKCLIITIQQGSIRIKLGNIVSNCGELHPTL